MLEVHILTERPLFVYHNSHDIPTSQKLAGGKQVTLVARMVTTREYSSDASGVHA